MLARIRDAIVTITALAALFPLYTYWSEAPDRARERQVQESQLLVLNAQMIVHCSEREKGWFTAQLAETLTKANPELARETPRIRLARACDKLGMLDRFDRETLTGKNLIPGAE